MQNFVTREGSEVYSENIDGVKTWFPTWGQLDGSEFITPQGAYVNIVLPKHPKDFELYMPLDRMISIGRLAEIILSESSKPDNLGKIIALWDYLYKLLYLFIIDLVNFCLLYDRG